MIKFKITNLVAPSSMVSGQLEIDGQIFTFSAVLVTKRGKSTTLEVDLEEKKVFSSNKLVTVKNFKIFQQE